MLTNLLDLGNNLSVRDVHKEEKSSKRSTGVLNIIISFNIVSQVLYLFRLVNYINNSLHLARKYARIFVRGHYLLREANSFPRAKLEENCELRGTDNVQGQISVNIFEAK